MLIIGFKGIGKTAIASKYSDKIIEIDPSTFRQDSNWPINYIENIKVYGKKALCSIYHCILSYTSIRNILYLFHYSSSGQQLPNSEYGLKS